MAVLAARNAHGSHVHDFIGGRKELTTEKANHLPSALGLEIIRVEPQWISILAEKSATAYNVVLVRFYLGE